MAFLAAPRDAELPRGTGGKKNVGVADYGMNLGAGYSEARDRAILEKWLTGDAIAK
jgi:hypothetical protein